MELASKHADELLKDEEEERKKEEKRKLKNKKVCYNLIFQC